MDKYLVGTYSLLMFLMFLLFGLGVFGTLAYQEYKENKLIQDKFIDGIRFVGNYTEMDALKFSNSKEVGDWVCVNVKGMDFERAVEVCQHEVGHEIFAEVCEKDMDKCLGVLNQ